MTLAPPDAILLLQRWQRLQMRIRCGLCAGRAASVRLYLRTGLRLARHGVRPATAVQLNMLQTLLQTARDAGLPWSWRSVCLNHAALPVAQLTALIGLHDPVALEAIEAVVQRARDRFAAAPPLTAIARSPR